MIITRRQFLAASAAIATGQPSVRWATAAVPAKRSMVVVFLRGGMDVLNLFAPAVDAAYESSRPAPLRVLAVGEEKGILVGGMAGQQEFLLNPVAKPLADMWKKRQLAFIPAAGLTNASRSHFQAMDLMERGISGESNSGPRDGWLTRAAAHMAFQSAGSLLSISGAMPQSLALCEDALPISDVWDVDWLPSENFREILQDMHGGETPLDRASRQAIAATGHLAQLLDRNSDKQPILRELPKGIAYPAHEIGDKLRFLAEMMRINPDIHVATVDMGGWDTHDNQPQVFSNLATNFAKALQAFQNHLDTLVRPTTVVVMSEFGRRLRANESRGTDHGHGGMMMVLGDGVRGGQNLGTWPGLAPEQLDQGMDLAVTTDFRDVLSTVLRHHGAAEAASAAFPGHQPKYLDGLFKT